MITCKVLSDGLAEELSGLPHSREMFFDCQNQFEQRGYTDIQRAARSLYLIKMSFGSDRRTFATAPKIASNISSSFSEVQDRLRKVIIEHLDFEQPSTICAYYNEFAERISLEHLDRICEALDCCVEDVLEYVPNRQK